MQKSDSKKCKNSLAAIENDTIGRKQGDTDQTYGIKPYEIAGCFPSALATVFNASGACGQYDSDDIVAAILQYRSGAFESGYQYLRSDGSTRANAHVDEKLKKDFSFVKSSTYISNYWNAFGSLRSYMSNPDDNHFALIKYDPNKHNNVSEYSAKDYHWLAVIGYNAMKNTLAIYDPKNGKTYNWGADKVNGDLSAYIKLDLSY